MIMRILPALVTAAALAVVGAGQAAASPAAHPVVIEASGAFSPYTPGAEAITYNPALVPVGGYGSVLAMSGAFVGTTTVLSVHGLLPSRMYGAHAHAKSCGPTGDAAGPHFQHSPDPVIPSVDPAYANPRNEIWLDFTTDPFGNGFAVSTVGWSLGDRHPNSVVIHEMHTATTSGHAGTAGARLACLDFAF
ncbi:MAG: superoxide dismutase [Amycolatopsis sp.]|nr:superoxide dismutase [Amycolatopsis sp.]